MTFPVNPNKGDTYNFDDTVWVFNGRDWDRKTVGSNNSTSYANNSLDDRVASLEALPFLAGYATEAYVGTQVTNLIDSAPGVLDTLNELAASIGDDANFITTINTSVAAVQADVDQNEADSDSADTALSGRLDVLEADPTTATAVAAVQADVDANEAAADSSLANLSTNINNEGAARLVADQALAVRVTALEVDPTTATAVAAVQADVNQNETDADAAIAAVQADVDANEAAALTARNAIQADVDQNEADADTAIAAVQADVDQNESDADAAIAAVQADVDANEVTAANAVTAAAGVAAAATAAQNTAMLAAVAVVQADVDQNETDADAAIAAVQADVDQNESDADQAIALRAPIADSVLTGLTTMASAKFSSALTDAADDTAAASAGIAVGQLYRNGSVVMIRVS